MRITATWFVGTFALLAGCGGSGGGSTDITPTLRFADRSDTEISRIVNAAVGAEMFQAQAQIDQFGDTFDPDPCPQIAISGNTATVTGGCTRADGVAIGGSAVITNPIGWDQIDVGFGSDATYEMSGLSFTDTGFTQTYDGEIQIAGDFRSWDADLTTDSFGVQLRTDLYMACSGSAARVTCSIGNSGIELIGIGGATLSGSQRVVDQRDLTTDLTLHGADTLTVHVADNCIAWSISGTDRHAPGPACP